MAKLVDKYNSKDAENKWQKYWQDNKIFKFDWNDKKRENIFSIDTPPPHVSGLLHMGHIFGYSQMDFIARFQRMLGKNVFYPVGYDDNGLPSERYVEKKIGKKSKEIDRQEFVKICDREIKDAESLIRNLFIKAGYSFDFDEEYRTISEMSRKMSQSSFLDLYNKGYLYQKEEPVIWDVVDQTALAQTEAEDEEFDSQMNYIKFELVDNDNSQPLEIMTTRPELIPACVGIFAHPEDKAKYEGKKVITPLGVEVPIYFDESVERDKGTGVMMCCTFGDGADVEKWKKYNLDLRIILNEKGCLFFDNVPEIDNKYKEQLEGLFVEKARKKILEILEEEGKIIKAPVKIKHNVKVGERSKYPIEILVKKQWMVKILEIKDELHKKASECKWNPEWMEARIHSWIDGLSWNWCVSRQRYFGVPVPVWYSKKPGEEGKVILPKKEQLPIDPLSDLPEGYSKDEVIGESDVFDTWATSAISPQLSIHALNEEYCFDKERYDTLKLPFNLRAQGHDIIRTWAFCTIAKAYYHENSIPWENLMINGWCLAPDGTKMSKSKGNVIDPIKILDNFGIDAIRYWTASSNLGTDTCYSENIVKNGQKLITKIFNASKFASTHFDKIDGNLSYASEDKKIIYPIDKWLIGRMKNAIENATKAFSEYEYAKAKEAIEDFFWNDFCDNYLEITKIRCYGLTGFKYENKEVSEDEKAEVLKGQQSAVRTIYYCLNSILKMFAPFIPHITEEIFSSIYENEFNEKKSISARGMWPKAEEFNISENYEETGNIVIKIIAEVRKYKTNNNLSMKTEVKNAIIGYNNIEILETVKEDLKNVCNIENLTFEKSKEFFVNIIEG